MMKLEWIVPVIVVIVYVIGWIIKAKEEIDAKAKRPVGKAPGQELDKFLQEIDRLRRQNEAAPVAVAARDDDDLESQPIVVRPVAPVATPRPVVTRSRPTPAPVAPRVFPAAPVHEQPVFRSATPRQTAFANNTPSQLRNSPQVTGIMALLRNPRTVASAMILNEVFGPPKSKRQQI